MEFKLDIEDQVQGFESWKSTVENRFLYRFGRLGQKFLWSGACEFESGSSIIDLIYTSSIFHLPYHVTALMAGFSQNPVLSQFYFFFSFLSLFDCFLYIVPHSY